MKLRRGTVGVALLGLLLALVAGSAAAQDDESGSADLFTAPTLVRAVDSTDPAAPVVQLMYAGDDLETVEITQEGRQAPVGEVAPFGAPIGTVVVVDVGATMGETGGLVAVRDDLAAVVTELAEDQEVAIISAGENARILTGLTSSVGTLTRAVDDLAESTNGAAAVWDGIRDAADMLAGDRSLQPNILVYTAGVDVNDQAARDGALGQAVTTGATVFVSGLGSFDTGPWEDLVAATGGSFRTFADAAELGDAPSANQSWQANDQFTVPFESEIVPEPGQPVIVETSLSLGGDTIDFSYIPGRFQQGATSLSAPEAAESGLLDVGFLQGRVGRLIGVFLVLVAVAMGIYAIAVIFTRDEGALSNVLQPYSEGYMAEEVVDDDDDENPALAKTALVQRAVSLTEQVAESQGYLSRTEAALERADLPLRAGEALFFYIAMVVVVAILCLVLFGTMVAILVTLLVALVPPAVVSFRASRRRKKFQELLPDTLQLLSGTLRAGYSLMQGVEAVSQEVAEPMGKELRRVVTESRLGRPLEDALEGVAERMASPDFAWAVMAIRIQREVGGNLSELLLTVAETMVQRERLRRDVQALTAEGRMSAMVLGFLPFGLAGLMFVLNPDYMGKLFDNTLGNILLGLALVAMLIGFAWMRQIIRIEI